MQEATVTNQERHSHPGPSKNYVVVLWLVCTAAVVPALAVVLIAEREVSQYHTSTFETYAREALDARDFTRVLRICTGALKTGQKRSDHWGKVHLLRAKAHAGLGDFPQALAELEAGARFWTRWYYYASNRDRTEAARLGTELGLKFLDSGKIDDALRAFSAAGLAGGGPVKYLYDLSRTLSPAQKAALWSTEPSLIVEDFEGPDAPVLETLVEEQGRVLRNSRIDAAVSRAAGSSALLEVGSGAGRGRSWYGWPVHIPLSERAFALRVFVREEQPSQANVILCYWFDLAHESAATSDRPTEALAGNWKRFDIERDFHAERLAYANKKGYVITGGVINKIGLDLPEGPANRFWVDRIELYLPDSGDETA